MPIVIATDDFNRANGTTGANWTPIGTQRNIVSNEWSDIGIGGADAIEYYNAATFPEDQYAQITMKSYSGTHQDECGPGLSLRVSGTSMANVSGYWAIWDDTATNNITIARWTSGSYAQLVQFSSAVAVNDVLRFEVEGAVLRFYKNGTLIGSYTDASAITGGKPGTATSNGGRQGTMDDWEAGNVSDWRLIQSKTKADGGTLAFDLPVSKGNFIVVGLEVDGASDPNPATPTDTRSTVYGVLRPKVVTPNNQCVALWGGIVPSNGTCTVTADSTTSFDGLIIAEFAYDGFLTSYSIDDSDDNYLNPITIGADGAIGDAMTPVGANPLAVMLLGTDNGGGMTFSDGSTIIVVGTTALAASANDKLTLGYASVDGAPASFTPKLDTSGGTGTSGEILEALVSGVVPTHTGFKRAFSSITEGGLVSWSNPGNAMLEDASVASVSVGSSQATDNLALSDWGFEVPDSATILGIVVRIKHSMNLSGDVTVYHRLHNDPINPLGTELSPSDPGTTLAWATYGGPTDLWGATLTPAIVNGPDFGIMYYALSSGTLTWSVDAVQMDVYYAEPSGAGEAGPTLIKLIGNRQRW